MILNLKIEVLKLFLFELHFDSASKKEEESEETVSEPDLIESLVSDKSK